MPTITGIELGPDSCVLVRARPLDDAAEISALHLIERTEWPQHDLAQATTLGAIRRKKRFPRRAHVVAWGLPEAAAPSAPHVRLLLKPVIAAGFRIDKVLTPPEALAALARTRPRLPGATVAWLALNVHGVAIAIVRDGELLFSRTFEWTYGGAIGSRAELLQRYSLVSHLAPEVRRGMMMARTAHGAIVDTVVTCGDLPELRSLTMPLIEELDLEVETLDSTEGLISAAAARNDRFAESAPALRLAAAAALSLPPRNRLQALRSFMKPAAAAGIVLALAWLGQRYWFGATVRPVGERITSAAPASAARTTSAVSGNNVPGALPPAPVTTAAAPVTHPPAPTTTASTTLTPPAVQKPTTVTPPAVAKTTTVPPPPPPAAPKTTSVTLPPAAPNPKTTSVTTPPAPAKTAPPVKTAPPPVQAPTTAPARTTPPPVQATSPATQTAAPPRQAAPPPVQTTPPPQAAAPKPAPPAPPPVSVTQQKPAPPPVAIAEKAAPPPATKPVATPPPPVFEPIAEKPSPETRVRTRPPVPLKEAVPAVESILVAKDRRVAIVGGVIVGVGDAIGSRVVAQIERDSVVLREPSGHEIRVRLRQGPGTE